LNSIEPPCDIGLDVADANPMSGAKAVDLTTSPGTAREDWGVSRPEVGHGLTARRRPGSSYQPSAHNILSNFNSSNEKSTQQAHTQPLNA
jgi:hypothetical protein